MTHEYQGKGYDLIRAPYFDPDGAKSDIFVAFLVKGTEDQGPE